MAPPDDMAVRFDGWPAASGDGLSPGRADPAILDVLLVADDDTARRRVRAALAELVRSGGPGERRKVTLHEALTVRGANEALRSRRFDCALVDWALPDGPGLALIEAAAAAAADAGPEGAETPMVLLTEVVEDGTGAAEVVEEALRRGAADALPRAGLDAVGLMRSIRFALERHRARRLVDAANAKLDRLVTLDPLTELPNRRALERHLQHRLVRDDPPPGEDAGAAWLSGHAPAPSAGRAQSLFAVLLDIDDLQVLNSRHGLDAGDAALRRVARAVEQASPTAAFVARVGGDEIAVVFEAGGAPEAIGAAERMRLAVGRLTSIHGRETLHITVSAGVAAVPENAGTVSAVLGCAERALARSKALGKDRVSFTDAPGEAGPRDDGPARTCTVVPETFDGHNLRTYRQPIVRLADGRAIGYEFHTRGRDGALITAPDLLRTADARDTMPTVDLRFLRRAVVEAARLPGWLRAHFNLQPGTLLDVPTEVIAQALHGALPPDKLFLELPIQGMPADLEAVRRRMDELREHGVRFVLDGVGGGGAAFEALLVLRPDLVKLAPAAANLPLDRLMSMARGLRTEVLAMGVETAAQAGRYAQAGVRLGQGFHFGRPEPCDIADP